MTFTTGVDGRDVNLPNDAPGTEWNCTLTLKVVNALNQTGTRSLAFMVGKRVASLLIGDHGACARASGSSDAVCGAHGCF